MQTIYYGGDIITMRRENDNPEALLVENDKIKYVGTRDKAEELAGQRVKKIHLEGKTLMPSFLDGHGHVSVAAQMSMCADLSNCSSFEAVVTTLKNFIKEEKVNKDGIAFGYGYDHNFLPEERHPVKEILDKVSDTIPVYISHISGHMGCANSVLLNLAGIDGSTPDPEGGVIGRREGSREPNGYLEEAGMKYVQRIITNRMKTDMEAGLKRVQEEYLRFGVTTVQDGASNKGSIALMKSACDSGRFLLDTVSYPIMGEENPAAFFEEYPECDQTYTNHFKLGGYKAVLDGSLQGKSAWLTKPYENSGGYRAYPWYQDDAVEAFMIQAVKDRRQILVHCNGDAAGDQFLRMYSRALEREPDAAVNDLRPVMIHCQTAREEQLVKMKELHMIPSVFVGHVYYWGDVHRKNLGEKRGEQISPCRSVLEHGLVLNLHQDTPVTKPDMMHSVWAAVNRVTRSGQILGKEQRISVFEALKAVTINTAYAYHEENEKGTLEPGKKADLVILEENPLKTDKMKIKNIHVSATIKDGAALFHSEN